MPTPKELTKEIVDLVDKLVRRNCLKFRMTSRQDDIKQDIIIKLITPSKNVKTNYLERFDESKNSMEGFLSRLIYNYFCRQYSRNKHVVEQAKSIHDVVENTDGLHAPNNRVVADIVKLERLYRCLAETYTHSSGVVYVKPLRIPTEVVRVVTVHEQLELADNEAVLWRSVSTVFLLLWRGMSQEEIASAMGVSKGWISKQVHKIRQLQEVSEWAAEFGLEAQPEIH